MRIASSRTSPTTSKERLLTVSALSLDAFARKLASADPTPGGGSASASTGAMGAALVSMVARLTAGSPKFKAVADRATAIGDKAHALMERLLRAVDDDAAAFDKVTAAFALPKSTDAEKQKRAQAIQDALLKATEPPMQVVEDSLEVCRLAAQIVDFGNPNAVSDIGCAALFANAAVLGAGFNVDINTKSLKDRERAKHFDDRVRSAVAQADLLAEVVVGKVRAATRPGG
jgi:formiminotetrahydrofolate cyclodeaminase